MGREQALKVKTANLTDNLTDTKADTKIAVLIRIACGASRRSWLASQRSITPTGR
jgi:hypothetical protein